MEFDFYNHPQLRIDMSYKSTLFKALFFTLAILPIILSAQSISLPQLSEKAFVSVITCSATPDYEGGFGHSALRIQDATLNIDVIFNFGSYSDKQPFFAYKILQGTVISYLDGEPFKKFADRYKNDGRGINEYYLNISKEQKQSLWEELNRILISGDRFYKFKVPTNNCSTQLRDVLFKQCKLDKDAFQVNNINQTYRDIEQSDPLQNSWLHLLFNVVIGPKADDPISLYQAAFNPGGLIELLKEVRQNNEPILMASHKICSPTVFKQAPNTAITQSFFSLLLLIACILSYLQLKKGKQYIWFDRLLFFLSGIFGCLLISLIITSEIELVNSNCNILWALPTNLMLAFVFKRNSTAKWIKIWLSLTCLSLLAFPISVVISGQIIPIEIYLFAATIFIRILSDLKTYI